MRGKCTLQKWIWRRHVARLIWKHCGMWYGMKCDEFEIFFFCLKCPFVQGVSYFVASTHICTHTYRRKVCQTSCSCWVAREQLLGLCPVTILCKVNSVCKDNPKWSSPTCPRFKPRPSWCEWRVLTTIPEVYCRLW